MQIYIFYYYLFIFLCYYLTGCDRNIPIIKETSINSENVIRITFNEDIYSNENETGNVDINDFTIYLDNEEITINENTSIAKESNQVYLLKLELSKIPNGTEIIKINPKKNSIYNSAGNAASETQQNNTVTLNKKTKPFIKETTLDADNRYIVVTFSEKVYSNIGDDLKKNAFNLTLSNSNINNSILIDNVEIIDKLKYKIFFNLKNIPNGEEILIVNINTDSVFDSVRNSALDFQQNNTIKLNKKTPPFIENTIIDSDNTYIEVTFDINVYGNNNKTGYLEKEDFLLTLNNGALDNKIFITNFEKLESGDKPTYKLNFELLNDFTPNGEEILTVNLNEDSVYDAFGNVASSTQNNQLFLNKKTKPLIEKVEISSENKYIDITFSEKVYSKNDGNGNLDINDFSLFIENSNNAILNPISINNEDNIKFRLFFELLNNYTPNGEEILTINLNEDSVFDSVGNVASITQNNIKIKLNKKTPPFIEKTEIDSDNTYIEVTFDIDVYSNNNVNRDLDKEDFLLTLTNGSLDDKISITNFEKLQSDDKPTYKLTLNLNFLPNGEEILTVNLEENSVYDAFGNVASSTQNNQLFLNKKTKPFILETSIDNSNSITVTFNEQVYSKNNGTGDLEKEDFDFSVTGGKAIINFIYVTMIQKNKYNINFSFIGKPNGEERITVNLEPNSVFDSVGNSANSTQNPNNEVNLIEKISPTITSTILNVKNINSIIDFDSIKVTFNEPVYSKSNGNGKLDVGDFNLTIENGVAIIDKIENIVSDVTLKEYTIYFSLNGNLNGEESLTVNPEINSIYDFFGNVASHFQSNNVISLNQLLKPEIIETILISEEDSYSVKVTFNEPVFSKINGTGNLDKEDFALTIENGVAIFDKIEYIVPDENLKEYTINFVISGIPNGEELLTINPTKNSIFDSSGNAALEEKSNNTVFLTSKLPPKIINTSIFTNSDGIWLEVTFDKNVYSNNNETGDLEKEDFTLSTSTTTVTILRIEIDDRRIYRIYFNLDATEEELLTINPKANSIFDSSGNAALEEQSNNTVTYFSIGPQGTIYIDVAFHMIQTNSNWTSSDNQKIQAQLDQLNIDYQTTTQSMLWDPNKSPGEQLHEATIGGNYMKIQFRLKTGPNSGGNKYYSLIHPNSIRPNSGSVNWNPNWISDPFNSILDGFSSAAEAYGVDYNGPNTKTLNAFFGESDVELLGFAQFPWAGFGTYSWGCWNLTSSMPGGTSVPYNLGKTMSHEVGHNLGLFHTWQDTDKDNNTLNDTPFHEGPNYGSYLDANNQQHPNNSPNIPDTLPNEPGRDPVYNIMNYSHDDSLFRFTDDQLFRMWSYIMNYMPALWNSAGNNSSSKNMLSLNKIQTPFLFKKSDLQINYKNKDQLFLKSHGGKCGCKHPLFTNPELAKGNTAIYNFLLKEEKIRCDIQKFKDNYRFKNK